MLTVRELFLKALAMNLQGVSWPKVQETLIARARNLGILEDTGSDFVEFKSGQRIWFDGKYHLTALWQLGLARQERISGHAA
jgi:hypothetical protein